MCGIPKLFVYLVFAAVCHPASAQRLQFSDCSAHALSVLKHRIYAPDKKLRPIILSRDVLHLSICNGIGAGMRVGAIEDVLTRYYELEMKKISIDPSHQDQMAQAARDACANPDQGPCVVQIYRRRDYQTKEEIPFAKSGGLPFGQFLGHIGVKGHYEITGNGAAAQAVSDGTAWSPAALAILQDASRDPDFYEWSNPLAHAQTENDPGTGLPVSQDIADAPGRFEEWSGKYLTKAAQMCIDKHPQSALYLLGYALHGIQDLVFHEGITNAEHSFRDFVEDEQVDAGEHYDEKMAMAARATQDLLHGFRTRLEQRRPGCWVQMTTLTDTKPLSTTAREALLRKQEKDFGIGPYLAYRGLAITVRQAINSKTSAKTDFYITHRWLDERQQPLLDAFVARILTRVAI